MTAMLMLKPLARPENTRPRAENPAPHRKRGPYRGPNADESSVRYCERRIAEEERLAQAAGSWEAGLIHEQTAMLYRAQLASLLRHAPRTASTREAS